MRPFNLEEAKAGAPVCTRNGRPVRIICFDAAKPLPIIGLISMLDNTEIVENFHLNGEVLEITHPDEFDLMMVSKKRGVD